MFNKELLVLFVYNVTFLLNRLRRRIERFMIAFCLLSGLNYAVFAQIGPISWFFEADGDYESNIDNWNSYIGDGYIPAMDIEDEGIVTLGRRQNGLCTDWHHVGRSYMGNHAYRFSCAWDPSDDSTRRSEQMLLNDWYAGEGVRYFSLAFKLYLPETSKEGKGYIAQLHQGGSGPPPFALAWIYDNERQAYFIHMGAYYDYVNGDNNYDYAYTEVKPEDPYSPVMIENGVWYRMLFAIDPGPTRALGDKAPGDEGTVDAWIMDNETGFWAHAGNYTGRIGYWYKGDDHTTDYQPRVSKDFEYQWKIGIYRNDIDPLTYYYDNISYAKRWYAITNNYLVGYHKSVLRYSFDDVPGTTINDESKIWNSDNRVDYDNDGEIVGYVGRNSYGVSGKSLKFTGSGYIRVPMDTIDFDFGNYQTTSVWFRTTKRLNSNRGLFTVDNYGGHWKVLMYLSDSLLAFGVRHPDESYTKANYSFTDGEYADGEWHHAVGTFNRFAPDGKRLKLYIDGKEVMALEGKDLPILRGEDFLSIGKCFSNRYFVGDIDEVNVFNYAMTNEEVTHLYHSNGAPQ